MPQVWSDAEAGWGSAASRKKVMAAAITEQRDAQRAVMHAFMENRHDPAGAREVLEALGLNHYISPEGAGAPAVSLLWGNGEMIPRMEPSMIRSK